MEAKVAQLWPEIVLFITTCVVMIVGLSPTRAVRRLCSPLCALGLVAAGYFAITTTPADPERVHTALPYLPVYAKTLIAGVGLILLLLAAGVADREYEAGLAQTSPRARREDANGESRRGFDPLRSIRAEFYSFFLFSLTGLMLCAGADDLIFLFLALELTSLPTYVMVTLSTARNRSMEAGVKYFFLGAMGAAIFLYGFALIYGGTGHTDFAGIQSAISAQAAAGGTNSITMLGLILALVGLFFKIAAVPMHFYTPDVYEGAAAPVGAFLAFVPKAAGFFAIMLVLSMVGWQYGMVHGQAGQVVEAVGAGHSLPQALRVLLWVIAVATMTIGNVLAILQNSVKRILAYSSIAHSGYMLVGVLAGPGDSDPDSITRNGLAAVLFYLLAYGVMTTGAFAVVACLERRTADGTIEEADHVNDLRGLWKSHPLLASVMVLCAFGLLGLPPLLGFLGKLPLFTAAISANEILLVLILGLNSAIAAYYYLRLVAMPFLEKAEPAHGASADSAPVPCPFPARAVAGFISALGVLVLGVVGYPFADAAAKAGRYVASPGPSPQPESAPEATAADGRSE